MFFLVSRMNLRIFNAVFETVLSTHGKERYAKKEVTLTSETTTNIRVSVHAQPLHSALNLSINSKMKTSPFTLNTHAVALLQTGMYREADSLLVRALAQFTEALEAKVGAPEEGSLPLAPDGTWRREQLRSSLRVVPIGVHDQILTVEQSFSPNNAFSFYNKSFLIKNALEYYSASTQQKQLSAVLWYNWGVSSQYAAISSGSSDFLVRALDLYSKSFKILIQPGTIANESMRLLLLAVCNNMGSCASHFSDEVTARGFHEYIQAILSNSRSRTIEYDFFRSTALLNSNTVMSHAPAA
jgi:hypothetical protein